MINLRYIEDRPMLSEFFPQNIKIHKSTMKKFGFKFDDSSEEMLAFINKNPRVCVIYSADKLDEFICSYIDLFIDKATSNILIYSSDSDVIREATISMLSVKIDGDLFIYKNCTIRIANILDKHTISTRDTLFVFGGAITDELIDITKLPISKIFMGFDCHLDVMQNFSNVKVKTFIPLTYIDYTNCDFRIKTTIN